MNKKIKIGMVALALMPLLASISAAASFMPSGARTSQPIGHYEFCRAYPGDCNKTTANPKVVTLTPELWTSMQNVNNLFNSKVVPVTDIDQWGVEEKWSYPVDQGDCEDYVLAKQKGLEDLGLPISSLLISVVKQKSGAGHAVLAVRTDRGDFVLDNLDPKILVWNKTEYRYLKRQSERNTAQWVSIVDSRQVVVGSVE